MAYKAQSLPKFYLAAVLPLYLFLNLNRAVPAAGGRSKWISEKSAVEQGMTNSI